MTRQERAKEKRIVKKVQAKRRALARAQKLPRSQLRSKRIKSCRAQVKAAEAELAKFRNNARPQVQRDALELEQHKWSRFVYTSPTGGTARVALQEVFSDGDARCAATGNIVDGNQRMIDFLIDVCDTAKGPVYINCILNGLHRDGSVHYVFRGADIDKQSAITSWELQEVAARHGIGYLNEDAVHWHMYVPPGP